MGGAALREKQLLRNMRSSKTKMVPCLALLVFVWSRLRRRAGGDQSASMVLFLPDPASAATLPHQPSGSLSLHYIYTTPPDQCMQTRFVVGVPVGCPILSVSSSHGVWQWATKQQEMVAQEKHRLHQEKVSTH